jgi:hypothetical protein
MPWVTGGLQKMNESAHFAGIGAGNPAQRGGEFAKGKNDGVPLNLTSREGPQMRTAAPYRGSGGGKCAERMSWE